MGDPFGLDAARERQKDLLREAEERRVVRSLRRSRRGAKRRGTLVDQEGVDVRWGLAEDESAVADLLDLNGVPRWVSFEERFIIVQKGRKVLGAVRYRTESKRLLLGLLVIDPWAGEEWLATALYRGAGDLALEIGAGEVVASASPAGYPGLAGYRRWGRSWHLDPKRRQETDNGHGPPHGA